jgi:hypothetical protein
MGWDFKQGATKKDIIADLVGRLGESDEYVTLVRRTVGNCLWAVIEHNTGDANSRYINLYLLESKRGYGWGYKSIGECMEPYECSCPLAFLQMVPEGNESWRDRVRLYWAAKAKRGAQAAQFEASEREAARVETIVPCLPHFSETPCPICALEE